MSPVRCGRTVPRQWWLAKLKANKEVMLSGSDEWLSRGMRKRKASRMTTHFSFRKLTQPGWMQWYLSSDRNTESKICLKLWNMRSIHQSSRCTCRIYQKTQSQMVETIRVCSISYYKCKRKGAFWAGYFRSSTRFIKDPGFSNSLSSSVCLRAPHLCEQDGPAAPGITPSHWISSLGLLKQNVSNWMA